MNYWLIFAPIGIIITILNVVIIYYNKKTGGKSKCLKT